MSALVVRKHARLVVALITVLCDSTVWSELGAAMPGSGGSFGYLRQGTDEKVGRLMASLRMAVRAQWALEIASDISVLALSGYIGRDHAATDDARDYDHRLVNLALLYRRIKSIAAITVALWVGTIVTVVAVIARGDALRRQGRLRLPPGAFNFSLAS